MEHMFRFTNYTIYAIVIITRSTRERRRKIASAGRKQHKKANTHAHTDR